MCTFVRQLTITHISDALAAQATGKVQVARHDRHTAAVDRAKVGVAKQTNKVRLSGFLDGKHGSALEAQLFFAARRDLAHQTLERRLAQQQVGALLVATDLAQRDSSGAESPRLLHSAGPAGLLGGLLRGDTFLGRLNSGLLGARRFSFYLISHCSSLLQILKNNNNITFTKNNAQNPRRNHHTTKTEIRH